MSHADLERLYRRHAASLYGFLAYRTGDGALAEDLLADVFERVLRTRRPFDPRRGSETSWLYAIALNVLRDHGRRRSREARGAAGGLPAEDVDPGPENAVLLRSDLRRAMAVLSEDEREVVSLRFGADLTAPQIARVTDASLTTVEGRLYRALRKLRAELDGEAPGSA